ncbi:MAG: hypothetical protein V1247_06790 [Acidimicrobiales bacterium]|jgi:hypothetical protein|nr:hypothetical protein [Acidimicrobiales bacterium]
MGILFVAGFSPIVDDPAVGQAFYMDTLGLPLMTVASDYMAMDDFGGTRHLGVWPISDAVESCFGPCEWLDDAPTPQATVEFEVTDVNAAASELDASGYTLIHGTCTEPRGQVITHLLGPERPLIGICYTPWMHET